MIPAHLVAYSWYAPHQVYCVQTYGYSRHQAPERTVARRADLYGANLRGANLSDANLSGAYLPAPTMLLLGQWGAVSDTTCIALMRLDASAHPDPARFDVWASGGDCPYVGVNVERIANFTEQRRLWSAGPAPTIWEAWSMVRAECCPDWTDEKRSAFEAAKETP